MTEAESKTDPEQSGTGTDGANGAATAPKATCFQRFKAHMKKWWWVYLIALIVVVLVVVLPLVYVGVPNFASDYINNYKYNPKGLRISNPTPDSFHVSQSQKFQMGGSFSGSGHLSAFDAHIKIPGSQEEFAVFPVPKINFDNGARLDIDQTLHLSCPDCLSQLAIKAASDVDFGVLVTGAADLKFGALPNAHLNIHKILNMDGYNVQEYVNTKGNFNVTHLQLLDPPKDNYNVNATVALKNPTPFDVEMGFVSFNLSISGSSIGYVDLPNFTLENDVTSTVVLGNIDENALIKEALGAQNLGEVTIDVHGNRCEYNGTNIPYYTAAIKAVKAGAKIDLAQYASQLL